MIPGFVAQPVMRLECRRRPAAEGYPRRPDVRQQRSPAIQGRERAHARNARPRGRSGLRRARGDLHAVRQLHGVGLLHLRGDRRKQRVPTHPRPSRGDADHLPRRGDGLHLGHAGEHGHGHERSVDGDRDGGCAVGAVACERRARGHDGDGHDQHDRALHGACDTSSGWRRHDPRHKRPRPERGDDPHRPAACARRRRLRRRRHPRRFRHPHPTPVPEASPSATPAPTAAKLSTGPAAAADRHPARARRSGGSHARPPRQRARDRRAQPQGRHDRGQRVERATAASGAASRVHPAPAR